MDRQWQGISKIHQGYHTPSLVPHILRVSNFSRKAKKIIPFFAKNSKNCEKQKYHLFVGTREVGFWCSLFGGFSDFLHYFKKECYICYEISFEIVRHLLNLYKVSVPRCFEIFEKNKNAKIEIFAQSLQIE